jgi:hypothetical protein
MADLHRSLTDDFATSPLVDFMLERSLRPPTYAGPMRELGDPDTRNILRARFFGHVTTPTGRELAHLDFAEVALLLIDQIEVGLPSQDRPRHDEQYEIAFMVADGVLREMEKGDDPESMDAIENEVSRRFDISLASAGTLVAGLHLGVTDFLQRVCHGCPVACHRKPDAPHPQAFFSEIHPALTKPRRGPSARR